ncbi:hypothetical protein Afil01_45850 [Actinorhabdospora filicis]|uniref:Uncharacterized protein n=1 Tax=Actinorhabdospora filicis TaxID=1785913 RepID=A0A9W6WB66_9ACTN|nr:hypothetical protein [Actinorhabdospora filicis]GLZ79778.1 hypothetical protein Afil01_45850 [Actinorhabdospora filicis]
MNDCIEVIGVVGMFVLVIATVVTVLRQVGQSRRARLVLARERSYESLADRSVTEQEHARRELAELRDRVTALEKILAEVD